MSGNDAEEFFEHLGRIDDALFSGLFAGFTQIELPGSTTNNTMLFLQPAASKNQFIAGLSAAAMTWDDPPASYSPLKNNGAPTTARAGVAFPVNDWLPNGEQYLALVGGSAQLRNELAALRQQHLAAVLDLLDAIEQDRVEKHLLPSGVRRCERV